MTPRRLALAVLATALAATGCGGGDGVEQEVKDDLNGFLSDRTAEDAAALCRGMTPESRRLVETIAKGRHGPDAGCADAVDERITAGSSGGVAPTVDDADVEVDGDVARVSEPGDDEELTLRKVEGDWLVDFASAPRGIGYSTRVSAACTENTVRPQRLPLPAATRPGIAAVLEREADGFARLRRLLEGLGPPPDRDEEHERLVAGLRSSEADLRRAVRGVRGVAPPLATVNRALRPIGRRTRVLLDEQRALGIACYGLVETRAGAGDYRRAAERICGRALRRMTRLDRERSEGARSTDELVRQGLRVGRETSAALKRLDPPPGLETLHRRSADALLAAYARLPDLARDFDRAEEKFDLVTLRAALGFARIGLFRCAQL